MSCLGKNKVVFLDRDGVINKEVNYLHKVEDLELIDGVKEAIKILKDNGYLVIVVSNQSGVARGYFTIDDMSKLHKEINVRLDGMIDDFLACVHHPDEKCVCRKPNVGLFRFADMYYDVDFDNSYMVGDKATDILAGFNAGLSTVSVRTGYGEVSKYANYVSNDLLEAVRAIICKQ